MRTILAVQNLSVSLYQRPILHDITFEIRPQQVFILTGPPGAGKSILTRAVCGLFDGQKNAEIHGQILYNDRQIQSDHAPSMVRQKAHMLLGTVFDNLSEQFPRRASFTQDQLRQNIEQFLCKLGLEQLADSLDAEVLDLATVQRKKLLIANTLLDNPALIALDAPTTGLDEQQANELLDFIQSLSRQHAVMMTTDNLRHAHAIGNVVCRIADGRIQESGPADAFPSPPLPPKRVNQNTDDSLDHLPEIEVFPLHDGPTTEPSFSRPPAFRQNNNVESSPFRERPITLTSTPAHTENNDAIVSVNEIPADIDVFAALEELYTDKSETN